MRAGRRPTLGRRKGRYTASKRENVKRAKGRAVPNSGRAGKEHSGIRKEEPAQVVVIDESGGNAGQGFEDGGGALGREREEQGEAGEEEEHVELDDLRINSPDKEDEGAEDQRGDQRRVRPCSP